MCHKMIFAVKEPIFYNLTSNSFYTIKLCNSILCLFKVVAKSKDWVSQVVLFICFFSMKNSQILYEYNQIS